MDIGGQTSNEKFK